MSQLQPNKDRFLRRIQLEYEEATATIQEIHEAKVQGYEEVKFPSTSRNVVSLLAPVP